MSRVAPRVAQRSATARFRGRHGTVEASATRGAHAIGSPPSATTTTPPCAGRKVKIWSMTSDLRDRRSRDQRNTETNGNSLGLIRGSVENAESDRSISVHKRGHVGELKKKFANSLGNGAPGRTRPGSRRANGSRELAEDSRCAANAPRRWRARKDSNLRPPA